MGHIINARSLVQTYLIAAEPDGAGRRQAGYGVTPPDRTFTAVHDAVAAQRHTGDRRCNAADSMHSVGLWPSRETRRGMTEQRPAPAPGRFGAMKKLFEFLVCFLHPLAVVLMWIDLASRRDMAGGLKLAWAIFGLIPLVPFIYVLTGGDLW